MLVLIIEGFHVPVTLFVEVVNKLPGVAFRQYGPSWVNVGVVDALTVIFIVLVSAH